MPGSFVSSLSLLNSQEKHTEGNKRLLPPPTDICTSYSLIVVLSSQPDKFPDGRAQARLQAHHINNTLVPAFYRYLQAQNSEDQVIHGKSFLEAIEKLVGMFGDCESKGIRGGLWSERGERSGELGWADVMAVPCMC